MLKLTPAQGLQQLSWGCLVTGQLPVIVCCLVASFVIQNAWFSPLKASAWQDKEMESSEKPAELHWGPCQTAAANTYSSGTPHCCRATAVLPFSFFLVVHVRRTPLSNFCQVIMQCTVRSWALFILPSYKLKVLTGCYFGEHECEGPDRIRKLYSSTHLTSLYRVFFYLQWNSCEMIQILIHDNSIVRYFTVLSSTFFNLVFQCNLAGQHYNVPCIILPSGIWSLHLIFTWSRSLGNCKDNR